MTATSRLLTSVAVAAALTKGTAMKNTRPEPINNQRLVADFQAIGGRVFHLRPTERHRGVTFAYVRRNSRIEFSTAVQHASDTFCKKNGTKVAIEHFNDKHTVTLPFPRPLSPVNLFTWMLP